MSCIFGKFDKNYLIRCNCKKETEISMLMSLAHFAQSFLAKIQNVGSDSYKSTSATQETFF